MNPFQFAKSIYPLPRHLSISLTTQFLMESLGQGSVKFGVKFASEHHSQVGTVAPVRFRSHLGRDNLVKFGPGKRVGNGNTNIVGLEFPYHLNGGFNIAPAFARITELQEKAGSDAMPAQ